MDITPLFENRLALISQVLQFSPWASGLIPSAKTEQKVAPFVIALRT